MKDKERYCPHCKNKMKYRGSRIFYCKICKKTFKVDHPHSVSSGKPKKIKRKIHIKKFRS